jgi:tryptophan 2,3-dioxygenase
VVSGLKSNHAELARLPICNSADVGPWPVPRQCSLKLLFHYDVKLAVRTYFIRNVGWVEWRGTFRVKEASGRMLTAFECLRTLISTAYTSHRDSLNKNSAYENKTKKCV